MLMETILRLEAAYTRFKTQHLQIRDWNRVQVQGLDKSCIARYWKTLNPEPNNHRALNPKIPTPSRMFISKSVNNILQPQRFTVGPPLHIQRSLDVARSFGYRTLLLVF